MNKQLKELLKERYGFIVMVMCIIILGGYAFSAYRTQASWYSAKSYYESEEFRQSFFPTQEDFDDETGEMVTVTPTEEDYQNISQGALMLFYQPDGDYEYPWGSPYSTEAANGSFSLDKAYTSAYIREPFFLMALIFGFGFLLFFVDLKSHFNTLLFSSGFSRQQLFRGKVLFVGIPLFASILIGKILLLMTIYWRIPHEFINAPFYALVLSIISNLTLYFCLFAFAVFVGTLVGNLITGPLVAVMAFVSLFWFKQGVFQYTLRNIYQFYLMAGKKIPVEVASEQAWAAFNFFEMKPLVVEELGKTMGYPVMWPIFIGLGLVFIGIASYTFKRISLEKNGAFLLLPQTYRPIWLFMSVYSLFFTLAMADPFWRYFIYEEYPQASATQVLIKFLLTVIITFLICGVIVYHESIFKKIGHWKNKLAEKRLAGL